MNEPYWCPKEGCDYGSGTEQKSKAAVRSHINASADHDWPTLKPLLQEQDDQGATTESSNNQGDEPDDEQATTSDEEAATTDEGGDEQATTSNDGASEQADSSDPDGSESSPEQDESTEMVSSEEYEQAHSDTTSGDTTESSDDTSQTSNDVGEMLPTLDTSTIVLGLAILGTLVVVWLLLNGDSNDDQREAAAPVRDTSDDRGWSPQDIEEVAA